MSESIMRLPKVRQRTGYSSSTIYRLEQAGGFPKRIKLGPRASGWIESEVDEWIEARIQQSREQSRG